jgi:hypothetical protein
VFESCPMASIMRRLPGATDDEIQILSIPLRPRRSGREIRMLIDGTDPFATAKPDARLVKLLIKACRFNAVLLSGDAVGRCAPPAAPICSQQRASRGWLIGPPEGRTHCRIAIISDHPPLDLSRLKRGQTHRNFAVLKSLTRRDPRGADLCLFGLGFDELGGEALAGLQT